MPGKERLKYKLLCDCKALVHVWIQDPEGGSEDMGSGPTLLLEKSQTKGVLNNTVPDPVKNPEQPS